MRPPFGSTGTASGDCSTGSTWLACSLPASSSVLPTWKMRLRRGPHVDLSCDPSYFVRVVYFHAQPGTGHGRFDCAGRSKKGTESRHRADREELRQGFHHEDGAGRASR